MVRGPVLCPPRPGWVVWEHVRDRATGSADGWSVSRERVRSHGKAASGCDLSPPVGGGTISRVRRTGWRGCGWRSPLGEVLLQHGKPTEPRRHPGSNRGTESASPSERLGSFRLPGAEGRWSEWRIVWG